MLFLFSTLFSCNREEGPPSFIFISLDTLRADTVGAYGYKRRTTPYIDATARNGLVFDQAVTVSNNTLISHISMMTGLYPNAHGARPKNESVILQESYSTIAEDLLGNGYQTAGFAAHRDWLCERFGFDQGFETYSTGYRDARTVLDEALQWMQKSDPDKPYFLFVHLYDIHSDSSKRPYNANPPFKGRYTKSYKGPLKPWSHQPWQGSSFLQLINRQNKSLTEEDARYLKGQYDEGVAYTDSELGRFFKEAGPLTNTYIIITSDHGEEFYEHGKMLHGSLYDEVVQIPLIIVPPPLQRKRFGAPRHVPEQVRTVDLRPTIASLAAITRLEDCQGKDLVKWLEGSQNECPAGIARLYLNQGMRYDGYKYITPQAGGCDEIFNLKKDPFERDNLALREDMVQRVKQMKAVLDDQLEADLAIRKKHIDAGEEVSPSSDPDAEERLRALGYF